MSNQSIKQTNNNKNKTEANQKSFTDAIIRRLLRLDDDFFFFASHSRANVAAMLLKEGDRGMKAKEGRAEGEVREGEGYSAWSKWP